MRRRTVIALLPTYRGFETLLPGGGRFEFGQGVALVPLQELAVSDASIAHLGAQERREFLGGEHAFVATYEADATLASDPAWHGPTPRTMEETALFRIRTALLALWLVRPTALGFRVVLDEANLGTGFELTRSATYWPATPLPSYEREQHQPADFERARALFDVVSQMPQDGAVWLSFWVLSKVTTDPEWVTRFLLAWIGVESLFGAETEITFRLSQRVGLFLGEDAASARTLFEATKRDYGLRSQVVHGLRLRRNDPTHLEALVRTEETLRNALVRILGDAELRTIFSGTERRRVYLDGLAFSRLPAPG